MTIPSLIDHSRPDLNNQKILIIDHDSRVRLTLAGFLSDELYDVFTSRDGIDGLETLREEKIDLAVVDKDIRGLDVLSLLSCLKVERIETNVLIMGGTGRLELMERMFNLGAVGVLDKPIVKDKFLAKLKDYISLNEVGYKVSRVREASRLLPRSFQQPLNTGREKVSPEALESFLEQHYRKSDLKFEDLTRYFGISLSRGHALFRKYFDKTFCEKLREIKIAQAEHFLTGSSLFIYEIAHLCGFRASNRFSEDFKRIHGISPTQYRKKFMRGEI